VKNRRTGGFESQPGYCFFILKKGKTATNEIQTGVLEVRTALHNCCTRHFLFAN